MKFIALTFFSLFSLLTIEVQSQIFGNTEVPDYGSYGGNKIVWIKIVAGPNDSGFFTHYGLYDHPTQGQDCNVRFALYNDNSNDRPGNILAQGILTDPTNGDWNELVIDPLVPIAPNTPYWIGLRFNCNYGSGRKAGTIWAEQPLRFKESWSYFSAWPNPAGSVSTQGNLNNVGLYLLGNELILPVEMLSFKIENIDNQAHLDWSVASEIDNEGWNIQRSTNGFSWYTIGFVEGKDNSNTNTRYSYTDSYNKAGRVYYRLEQLDTNGDKNYSEVQAMQYSGKGLSIYPTTTSDVLTIKGLERTSTYKIANASGQIVKEGTITQDERLQIENLSTGIHFLLLGEEIFNFYKM